MLKKGFFIVALALMLILLTVTSTFAASATKFSLDLAGTMDFKGNEVTMDSLGYGGTHSTDVSPSLTFGYEYTFPVGNFEFGAGCEYQMRRSLSNEPGKFNFIPIYVAGYYHVPDDTLSALPYLTARAGYNLFMGDSIFKRDAKLIGGMYVGFGGGFVFNKKIDGEAFYSCNNGSISCDEHSTDVTYTKISITVKYKLN